MKNSIAFLNRQSTIAFLFFMGVFWTCMLYVFWPIVGTHTALPASDAPNLFEEWWITEFIRSILAGDMTYANLIFPIKILASYWNLGIYYMTLGFFASLSMTFYLRTQNLSRLAAYGGGLLFGFSGYWFTLFHAGHAGTTLTWGYIVLPFALINRCFQTKKLVYFALLGVTLVWSMPQIDVWMITMFLFAMYGLWCSAQEWKATKKFQFLWQVYPRFLLTFAIMLLVGFSNFQSAFSSAKVGREAQFKEALETSQKPDKNSEAESQEKLAQWVFCTNWSLPPEDILEFCVPGIFGDASFQPPYPYWGRLGRDYQFEIGKMRPNLRQHTIHIGVITVMLAMMGMMGWVFMRKQQANPTFEPTEASFRDVPFWTVAALVLTLFAMGRYTPLYNIPYYCLPFGNYLRAPVKWFHLAEIAIAMLAGFGLQMLLQRELASFKKKAWIIPACFVGILMIVWLVFSANSQSLTLYISQLGFGNLAPALLKYSLSNIGRTLLVVIAVGGLLLWLSAIKGMSQKLQSAIIATLVVMGTVDLALVARRYVIAVNIGPHRSSNAVVQALKKRSEGRPANIMNYVTSGNEQQDWLSASLRLHGYPNMAPAMYDPAQRSLYERYQAEPLKYWELKGVQFVFIPRKSADALIRQGILEVVGDFQLQGTQRIISISPNENSFVLAEVKAFSPLPALYFNWRGDCPAEKQVTLLQQSYTMGETIVSLPTLKTPNPARSLPTKVVFDSMLRQKGVFKTRGRIEVAGQALLVFSEPYSDRLKATINGKEVPVGQANGHWAAIQVPSGSSYVTLFPRSNLYIVLTSVATSLCVLLWFGLHLVQKREKTA